MSELYLIFFFCHRSISDIFDSMKYAEILLRYDIQLAKKHDAIIDRDQGGFDLRGIELHDGVELRCDFRWYLERIYDFQR